jgi:hypothetical protein
LPGLAQPDQLLQQLGNAIGGRGRDRRRQCGAITQGDFSTLGGVRRYIDDGGTPQCSAIAQSVALSMLSVLQPADAAESEQNVHAKTV